MSTMGVGSPWDARKDPDSDSFDENQPKQESIISSDDDMRQDAGNIYTEASRHPRIFAQKYSNAPRFFKDALDSSEDIANTKAQTRENTTKFIRISIVIAIAIFAAVALIVITSSLLKSKKNNDFAQTIKDDRKAFIAYANSILFGDNTQKSIEKTNYSPVQYYKIQKEITNTNVEYLNTALEDYKKIQSKILDNKDYNLNEGDVAVFSNLQSSLEYVHDIAILRSTYDINANMDFFAKDYFKNGEQSILNKIENKYNKYANTDNASVRTFAANMSEVEKNSLRIIKKYYESGCIDRNFVTINENCHADIAELEAHQQELINENQNLNASNVPAITGGCWRVLEILDRKIRVTEQSNE